MSKLHYLPLLSVVLAAQEPTLLKPVVVTAGRTESRLEEVPQRIEVITAKDLERTPMRDLTDLLKRASSVDVIQYPGALSGIGIRGFRPEFSGINKHTLLLIDGRPAMSTNLSLVNMDQVERIEVLKGPASALYGSSAMGGVINLITRQSKGGFKGQAELGLGDFALAELRTRMGGSLAKQVDFDYAGSWSDQGRDFQMGNGTVRPNTSYTILNQALRFGFDLSPAWRLSLKGDLFRGRDIATPGDVAYGAQQQSNKDMDRHGEEVRLQGRLGTHTLTMLAFNGREQYDLFNKTSMSAADLPYLPYKSYNSIIQYRGAQVQDTFSLGEAWSFVAGLDFDHAESATRSWDRTKTEKAPYTANNQRDTLGIYTEGTYTFNGGRSAVILGVRHDRIEVETLATPLKTNFNPSTAAFTSTNPSFGFRHTLAGGFRLHATAGRGYVIPDASYLTGEAVTVYSNRTEILRGNPGIKPESSRTVDLGLEWSGERVFVDLTAFDTTVMDKIVRNNGVKDGTTTTFSYVNADSGSMRGLEADLQVRPVRGLKLFLGATHYLHAEEKLAGVRRDVNNVGRQTVRFGFDLEQERWDARLGWRFVGRTRDQDWVYNSGNQVAYGGFGVADLSFNVKIDPRQSLRVLVENLADRYYAEKAGYPQPGRALKAIYRWSF
jgi:vitamin B12 transporter